MYVFVIYSGTPLIRPPLGQKKNGRINGVAVLTTVFFYKKMYGGFCQAAKTIICYIFLDFHFNSNRRIAGANKNSRLGSYKLY